MNFRMTGFWRIIDRRGNSDRYGGYDTVEGNTSHGLKKSVTLLAPERFKKKRWIDHGVNEHGELVYRKKTKDGDLELLITEFYE